VRRPPRNDTVVSLEEWRWNEGERAYNVSEAVLVSRPSFFLSRGAPNPATSRTEFTFGLDREGRVLVELFNVHGRKVRTLLNETRSRGPHVLDVDCHGLASGTYFVRLQAGSFLGTRKLIVIQ
jgi:hypothetical protein